MGHSEDVEQVACAAPCDDRAAHQMSRVWELVAGERWDEALPLCEAVVRNAPDLPGIFQVLGDVRANLKMWEPAARSYLDAIARDPDNAILFQKLGDLQRRCGDVNGASKSYRRAADLGRDASHREDGTRLTLRGSTEAAAAYLELMKGCLTFLLWEASDGSVNELNVRRPVVSFARILQRIARWLSSPPISVREFGMDWPAKALTMVGEKRLDNIQECVERVLQDAIPGDLLEAGVWRGGVTIFMRAILRAYGDTERRVWVADSFCGLPRPNVEKYPADRGYDLSLWHCLAISCNEVRENFRRLQLLDDQVEFLEGWFADTLPVAPVEHLSVLRLDGDLYGSTIETLQHLYSKVSPGGFVIVDDYYSSRPCGQAVDDFRRANAIQEEIVKIDWSGAFWRKQ